MAGVMRGFANHVAPADEGYPMLVGPAVKNVSDDPQGAAVYGECLLQWPGSGAARSRCAPAAGSARSRKPSRIPSGSLMRSHRASETTTGSRSQSGAPSESKTVGRAASLAVDPSVQS